MIHIIKDQECIFKLEHLYMYLFVQRVYGKKKCIYLNEQLEMAHNRYVRWKSTLHWLIYYRVLQVLLAYCSSFQ